MIIRLTKSIPYLYYSLFFLVPLVLFHKTSELFEFNKIIVVYAETALITGLWIIKMIVEKKVVFKRTFLDLPIVIFIISQLLSTLVSVDIRTSFFGYYSRFNGGLLSSLSYSLLYWAYVSNMNYDNTKKLIKVTFISAVIASTWAIFEHFGRSFSCFIFPEFGTFDTSCWVQDVQFRVFSSFGQPNWLAAFLVSLIPITWSLALVFRTDTKSKLSNFPWLQSTLFLTFFITLLFTKSRSGLLGYITVDVLYWGSVFVYLLLRKKEMLNYFLKLLFIFNITAVVLVSLIGTSWNPTVFDIIKNRQKIEEAPVNAPALEVGGTASSKIRTIVWKGAIDIWKNYPVLGTGVETFAFSYYAFRPVDHNMVSEWDYLYNKAHNEYLNIAATTGTIGILAYFVLIIFSFIQLSNYKSMINTAKDNPDIEVVTLSLALSSAFVGILVTNFFGFSVVPVSLLFFLYPAMAMTLTINGEKGHEPVNKAPKDLTINQQVMAVIILITSAYFLYLIGKYWYADVLYASGKYQNDAGNYSEARGLLKNAVSMSPNEAIYWEEMAQADTNIAVMLSEGKQVEQARTYKDLAQREIMQALSLSDANVNLKRSVSSAFIKLSAIDPTLIISARDVLYAAVKQAPTDAKLTYNLGLSYIRTGEIDKAIDILKKTTQLKPDYRNAYYALGLVYIDAGQKDKAKEQFEYVLKNINPDDVDIKRELDEIK